MMAHLPGSYASPKSTQPSSGGLFARVARMAEVLAEYSDVVISEGGKRYVARACGAPVPSGQWQGWLEFIDLETGHALRSGRETTQPNRVDTVYWATGLTPIYLEGALQRALHPRTRPVARPAPDPAFDGPAPDIAEPPMVESILNPFSVYRKGEGLLRRQLSALSVWHLVNIILDYRLSDLPDAALNAMAAPDLIEVIVTAVRNEAAVGRL
jgi:hypothetical protein